MTLFQANSKNMRVLAMEVMILIVCCLSDAILVYSLSSSMHLNQPFTSRPKGNETDRLALLAIKGNIQHDPSRVLSSWNSSIHFCFWRGVTCGSRHRQRVTILDLNSQGLAGSLSPHIGNLSFLREVYLFNNSFTQQIPPQIGRLRRLQVLYFTNNSFTGSIPTTISNCSKLIFLSFRHNKLEGEIPCGLGFLSKLQHLNLQDNSLTGEIPPSIGNLSYLAKFSATNNSLGGSIPSSIGQLRMLTILGLGENNLSGTIPPSIYNLSALVAFSVAHNQIQGSISSQYLSTAFPNMNIFLISDNKFTGSIPLWVSNATSLVSFEVTHNNLTGQVPNLQKLQNLTEFFGAYNHLGSGKQGDMGFVSELVNATRLRWLVAGYNNLGGTLPPSVSNLSSTLEVLCINDNSLHGSIPIGLGNLVNLQSLILEGNSFTDNIPTDIGKLPMLIGLNLRQNQLSGGISSSLGNLTKIIYLNLDANNLGGSIPSSLGKCQKLLKLDLSQNNFNGTIPQQLLVGLLSLSISLNLSGNNFVGSIPAEIGKLRNLGVLDFSGNMLSGELPNSLGDCESLEVLHLQGNFFKGLIPPSIKDLRGLRELDLSRNNLSGVIPQFFKGLTNLEFLNLSFNHLWGEVPVGGVLKNASATSVVGNTALCGGIAELRLPVCKFKARGLSRTMKIVVSLALGFALLVIAIVLSFILHRKKRKAVELNTLEENPFPQVSYATLLKATDEFSSTNLIGKGGFGSVYKGILELDKVVAVKVLNMLHKGATKSFIAECEALRNIRHRNLVKIITACSSIDFRGNDFRALIYEFMENGSLEEWLHPSTRIEEVIGAPKSLSLVQRLNIAIDVASALDYLHNHCETPIVHCDLKPSNILMDKELTGHVSDFGLARFISSKNEFEDAFGTQSSSIGIRGSAGYVAPEYGMGSAVSTCGDVYSFGILLLEMFTGRRPTDPMFSENLNLHNFVKMALPEQVEEITDSLLDITTVDVAHNQPITRQHKIEECLKLIFDIGIACSAALPTNRKDICEVLSELHFIRSNLFG